MLDDLKDLRAIVESAIRNKENGDTTKYKKSMERAALLCDQILRAEGTRFEAVDLENPLHITNADTATGITREDIINGGVPK